jgi:hypothetical protein
MRQRCLVVRTQRTMSRVKTPRAQRAKTSRPSVLGVFCVLASEQIRLRPKAGTKMSLNNESTPITRIRPAGLCFSVRTTTCSNLVLLRRFLINRKSLRQKELVLSRSHRATKFWGLFPYRFSLCLCVFVRVSLLVAAEQSEAALGDSCSPWFRTDGHSTANDANHANENGRQRTDGRGQCQLRTDD